MSDSRSGETGAADAPRAPEARKNFDRLKALLREMFQLDRGDLDFGLYRIMNMKAAEIEAFLDRDLLPQVKDVLTDAVGERRKYLEWELGYTIRRLTALSAPTENNEKVLNLREELAETWTDADAEADVYNHLTDFFARYYDEGDFMSLRRYSGGGRATYLIPYDGEEVKLHWANADQYYIKTTENYAAYAFVGGDGEAARRTRFEIAAADNEKDNVKEANGRQRRFVLAKGGNAVARNGDELVVRFEHRPLTDTEKKTWPGNGTNQQSRINQDSAERILDALDPDWRATLAAPAPTEADPERTVLARHIERYTARNSFDYFIHKDLGGFLERELDLYLKSEVLNLDDLALGDADRLRRALGRMRAVRHVAGKIIAFLAQLEDFQKRLWLKKKFVLETHWCVTLDRVPKELHPEIAANAAQRKEWVDLFAIDESTDYEEPLSPAFLEANPYLIVDTRHFDADFEERLLTSLSDAGPLDERTDGLLIHGENFQALNLLRTRYAGQVQCIYIDPPYNTASSSILYKNDHKDSSWLSLMENRLFLAKSLMVEDGILCCAIDDEEIWRLRALLQNMFDKEIGVAPVRSTPIGRTSVGKLSPTHEYVLFYGSESASPGPLVKTERENRRYPFSDEHGRYAWRNLLRTGTNDRRVDRPKLYYPIFVSDNDVLRIPKMEWDEENTEYVILDQPHEDEVIVWPVREQNGKIIEKNWERGWERVSREVNEYRVRRNNNGEEVQGISIHFIQRMDVFSAPKTWWADSKYASSNHGAKALKDLFVDNPFDFPKSVPLVEDSIRASGGGEQETEIVDYFAGSGTTGHAVINLNRDDGGRRKYILVEMGDHFDTVMLPRLKKVAYAPDWKGGKPAARDKGMSQVIKYLRLESYEDTLDGLVLTPPDGGLLAENDPTLIEDYRLRYALDAETSGSPCLLGKHFADPFAYSLSVVRDGARRDAPVDLPETFNYLLGLRVESRRHIDGVLAINGRDTEGRICLILWRNLETTDNKALGRWFTGNRARFPESLDLVYANGDHNLNAVRRRGDTWTAEPIEPLFRELMFEADGV